MTNMCSPRADSDDSELDFEDSASSDTDSDDDSSEAMLSTSDESVADGPSSDDEAGVSRRHHDAEAGPSREQEENTDEEDEIVKAFKRAKEVNRNHPADIVCEDILSDISFSPNNNIIAAGTLVGDVQLFKYSNEGNELAENLELHNRACRSVEFSEDGLTLFTASKDKCIILTDVNTGKMKKFIEESHENPIYKLKIIDENRFATGDENGYVKVWDVRQDKSLFSLKENDDYVSDMVTNDSKRFLVVSSGEGTITSINLITQKLHVQSEIYDAEITALGMIKHDKKLIAASAHGRLFIFNWGEFGYHSDQFPGPKVSINHMLPLTENIVVTGSEDGKIRATHLFPHQQLGIVGQHRFPVESMDISGDGELLASSSHDCIIKFWNVKYFEDIKVSDKDKVDKRKVLNHNLPSSKAANPGDFFADLKDTT